MNQFKAKSFPESMKYAVRGWRLAFQTDRNVRSHCFFALLVMVLAVALRLNYLELAVLALVCGLVIACELVNTAVETVVDLVTQDYHPLAAVAKNVAAGAVLMAAATAVVVGGLIFIPHLAARVMTPLFVATLAVLVVVALTLAIKLAGGHAHLRGGMPSAHTAAAASLATSVYLVSRDSLAALLAATIAALVAQSRVEGRIHSLQEVCVGGAVGVLLTLAVYWLLLFV